MKKKTQENPKEIAELKAGWQRTVADFENYKKRVESEKTKWSENTKAEILHELLPILDNLHLMSKHAPENLKKDNWAQGALLAISQIEQKLTQLGVEKFTPEVGSIFNHNEHEAVRAEKPSKIKPDHIVSCERPGYRIGETLIRPAQVIVSSEK